jgi:menaquinol-cytochrome c reductase iron-sulfur subunit
MGDNTNLTRRNFLSAVTWAIGGIISIGMGIPAVAYIIGPATQKQETEAWIRLGSTSKIEIGTPSLFKVNIQRQTGWIVNQEELSVYVYTNNGRDFVAMSNICTHLGCRIRWIVENEEFYCPCHNGIFDKDGNVVSGPPPRSLDRYQTKVEDGSIFILGG